MNVKTGFTIQQGVSAEIDLPDGKYSSTEATSAFYKRLLEGLQQQPGVRLAGLTSQMPLQGEIWSDGVSRPGNTEPPSERPTANVRFVSPTYFQTLGIALENGRTFEKQGREYANAVIVSTPSPEDFGRERIPWGKPCFSIGAPPRWWV